MNVKQRSLGLVTTAIILWSSVEVISKHVQPEINPLWLTMTRFSIGVLTLAIVYSFERRKNKRFGIPHKKLVLLGLLGLTITFSLFQFGIYFTKASSAAVIYSTNPIFVTIFAAWQGEKVKRYQSAGILLGFIGVFLVMAESALEGLLSTSYLLGNILMLLAGIGWASYTIYGRKYVAKYGAIPTILFSLSYGLIFLFPIALVGEDISVLWNLSLETWAYITFLGVIVVGLGFVLYFKGLEGIEASRGITPFYLKPVLASIIAWLWLGESIGPIFVVGLAAVASSIILAQK
jgi:drug/metabolite transporter (DMT)-like permease